MHGVDPQNKVHDLIAAAHEDTEIFPLIKNYNVLTQEWDQGVAAMLKNPAARQQPGAPVGQSFWPPTPAIAASASTWRIFPTMRCAGYNSLIERVVPPDAP